VDGKPLIYDIPPLASEEIYYLFKHGNLAKQNGLKDSFCGAGN
jgi:hypothetical protein